VIWGFSGEKDGTDEKATTLERMAILGATVTYEAYTKGGKNEG
jgi:hypothetical protein